MLCKVIDKGHVYAHHIKKAKEMGADVPKNKKYTSKYKWRYGLFIARNGDIYKILNKQEWFVLIESCDGVQFLIDIEGIEKVEENFLENELFDI